MPSWNDQLAEASKHLHTADGVMPGLMRAVGPVTLKRRRNRFWILASAIIGQQVSTAAARTIRGRVEALVAPDRPTAENIARLPVASLRSAGLSGAKASYLQDLANKTLAGEVRFDRLARLSDEAVIAHLTAVRGIGRWTAEMFLMFSLGRLDVLPVDDLGLRGAIRTFYDLAEQPSAEECRRIAEPWRPYATVASWYCWQALDQKRRESRA